MASKSASIFKKTLMQATWQAGLLLCLGALALTPARLAAQGSRCIKITTPGYAGSAPLTNCPLLVRL